MKVTFIDSVEVAKNIWTFHFKPEQPVSWEAGQYTQLQLPHDNPDERGTKRWFTVSASPTEDNLAITTKFSDPSSSFKTALQNLKPGMTLELDKPDGDFILPTGTKTELIFIAGGIGVTPFRSMVKYLTDKGQKRQITLIYAVSKKSEMVFMDLFNKYGVTVVPMVGQRLTVEQLMLQIGEAHGKLVYLSGPEPMVEALNDGLIKAGLPKDQLKADYFPGYSNDYSS